MLKFGDFNFKEFSNIAKIGQNYILAKNNKLYGNIRINRIFIKIHLFRYLKYVSEGFFYKRAEVDNFGTHPISQITSLTLHGKSVDLSAHMRCFAWGGVGWGGGQIDNY